MAIPIQAIIAAAEFLKSPAGRKLLKEAGEAVAGKAGDKNVGNISGYEAGYSREDDDLNSMSNEDKRKLLRNIMVGGPKDYLVRAAASAATGLSDAIGNIAVTDANHLASAILAANRVNSNRQNEIYGPSKAENAANMWAQERLRRGENTKNITDQVTETIRDVARLYGQREDVSRAMEAQTVLRAPGNFYNYANSLQRASEQAKKNNK